MHPRPVAEQLLLHPNVVAEAPRVQLGDDGQQSARLVQGSPRHTSVEVVQNPPRQSAPPQQSRALKHVPRLHVRLQTPPAAPWLVEVPAQYGALGQHACAIVVPPVRLSP